MVNLNLSASDPSLHTRLNPSEDMTHSPLPDRSNRSSRYKLIRKSITNMQVKGYQTIQGVFARFSDRENLVLRTPLLVKKTSQTSQILKKEIQLFEKKIVEGQAYRPLSQLEKSTEPPLIVLPEVIKPEVIQKNLQQMAYLIKELVSSEKTHYASLVRLNSLLNEYKQMPDKELNKLMQNNIKEKNKLNAKRGHGSDLEENRLILRDLKNGKYSSIGHTIADLHTKVGVLIKSSENLQNMSFNHFSSHPSSFSKEDIQADIASLSNALNSEMTNLTHNTLALVSSQDDMLLLSKLLPPFKIGEQSFNVHNLSMGTVQRLIKYESFSNELSKRNTLSSGTITDESTHQVLSMCMTKCQEANSGLNEGQRRAENEKKRSQNIASLAKIDTNWGAAILAYEQLIENKFYGDDKLKNDSRVIIGNAYRQNLKNLYKDSKSGILRKWLRPSKYLQDIEKFNASIDVQVSFLEKHKDLMNSRGLKTDDKLLEYAKNQKIKPENTA